ncbi:carboxymuconolactone decarboxylase family protein [Saccharothrix syringae]|uniref:Carboxymuconolactone decarboxylase family protein n=1 Tax=Saccharothrix syringae TaxID=103733 RepID=A0A5Q0H3C6_SACSY|nr:carboxymuconolactone decarboxylase family protein [Saccharothrix syringae]QFZ20726.1 carboxymuconolactone decarboxylase family protein [Saccharothrix syringae]
MRATLVQVGLRGLSTVQVRRVRPVRFGAAGGDVARVYRELERDFGVLAPPVALHSPAPDVLAAAWVMLRETLLVPGTVPRAVKEAVSTAVSEGNECPFCVTMHSSMLNDLVGGRDGADRDPAARAAADWARAGASPDTAAAHPVPFPADQAPEIVGTAVVLHYLNRMVNLFLGELPLPPGAPAASMVVVRRVLVHLIKSAERRAPRPGASLDLLPDAPLPGDLGWARGHPAIAGAFARGVAAVELAGRRSAPEEVRELVSAHLSRWDGRPVGVSRAWVEDAVAGLSPGHRATGRLALLTALASYQVDQGVVDAFRAVSPTDRALIDVTAWASLAAARRIGGWARTS